MCTTTWCHEYQERIAEQTMNEQSGHTAKRESLMCRPSTKVNQGEPNSMNQYSCGRPTEN